MDALARAVASERAWLRAQATEVTPVALDGERVGEVIVTAHARAVRDHNAIVLDEGTRLEGASVVALANRELGGRGFDHRRVYCATTNDADHLRTALTARGYEVADTLVMRWPGGTLPTPVVDGVSVVEADGDLVARWTRVVVAPRTSESVEVESFVRLTGRQHQLGVRFLVARSGHDLAGGVRVYLGDDIAQVEELDVMAPYRRRGLGQALLAAALALAGDRDLVFLTSEPGDWPTTWYRRLGFQVVGRSTGFSRVPDDASP